MLICLRNFFVGHRLSSPFFVCSLSLSLSFSPTLPHSPLFQSLPHLLSYPSFYILSFSIRLLLFLSSPSLWLSLSLSLFTAISINKIFDSTSRYEILKIGFRTYTFYIPFLLLFCFSHLLPVSFLSQEPLYFISYTLYLSLPLSLSIFSIFSLFHSPSIYLSIYLLPFYLLTLSFAFPFILFSSIHSLSLSPSLPLSLFSFSYSLSLSLTSLSSQSLFLGLSLSLSPSFSLCLSLSLLFVPTHVFYMHQTIFCSLKCIPPIAARKWVLGGGGADVWRKRGRQK